MSSTYQKKLQVKINFQYKFISNFIINDLFMNTSNVLLSFGQ